MNQFTTLVMILTTGGAFLFFRRKLWKYHQILIRKTEESEKDVVTKTTSEIQNRRLDSMETILRKAEELRNLICETSFASHVSDLSLTFLSEGEDENIESEDSSDDSFYGVVPDIPTNKAGRVQLLREIARLTYLSPANKQQYLSFSSPTNSTPHITTPGRSGPALEWESPGCGWHQVQESPGCGWHRVRESPGCGWHQVRGERECSDYGSVDSSTDEEIEDISGVDHSDSELWEWDTDDYHHRSYDDSLNLSRQVTIRLNLGRHSSYRPENLSPSLLEYSDRGICSPTRD